MRHLRRAFRMLLISMLILPVESFAWGRQGHAIVAEVAMEYLSKPARKKVLKILHGMSAADAGNWMDNIRSDSSYNYMDHWHYLDIPKGGVFDPAKSDNLVAALNAAFKDLEQGKLRKRKRREDLLILFHLLGDMHQPLHTGYPEDKGGNTVMVNFNGKTTRLHHLWDVDIIDDQKITLDSVMELAKRLPEATLRHARDGNFVSWMKESRTNLPEVYDFAGSDISHAYMEKNRQLVEMQLLLAGIRLAKVLDVLYGEKGLYQQRLL